MFFRHHVARKCGHLPAIQYAQRTRVNRSKVPLSQLLHRSAHMGIRKPEQVGDVASLKRKITPIAFDHVERDQPIKQLEQEIREAGGGRKTGYQCESRVPATLVFHQCQDHCVRKVSKLDKKLLKRTPGEDAQCHRRKTFNAAIRMAKHELLEADQAARQQHFDDLPLPSRRQAIPERPTRIERIETIIVSAGLDDRLTSRQFDLPTLECFNIGEFWCRKPLEASKLPQSTFIARHKVHSSTRIGDRDLRDST